MAANERHEVESRVTWCCIGSWVGIYVQIYLLITSFSCS
jgi:hypothetical protein